MHGGMTIPLQGEGLGLVGEKKRRVDSVFDASAAAHSIGRPRLVRPGRRRILRWQNLKTGLGRPRAQ